MVSRAIIDTLLSQARERKASDPAAALDFCMQAKSLAEEVGNQAGLANSLLLAGICQNKRSEFQAAVVDLTRALALFKTLADLPGEAETLNELGVCCGELGETSQALTYQLQSLALWQKLDEPMGLALCLNNLGNRYYYFAQFDSALDYYQQSLAIRERIGDQTGMGQCYNNIAIIYDKFGNNDLALEYYQKSLKICEQKDDPFDTANSLYNIGDMLYESLHQPVQAKEAFLRAQALVQGSNKMLEALILEGLSKVARGQQDYDQALTYLDTGIALLEEIGGHEVIAELLVDRGKCQIDKQDVDGAVNSLQRALDLATQHAANENAFLAHEALTEAYEQKGDFASALEHYKAFHQLREVVFNSQTELKVKGLLIKAESDKARSEAEIYRLKHEELSKAHTDLQNALDENQKLYHELQLKTDDLLRQVWQDPITNIYNRRFLEKRLAEEGERAQRFGHDLTVALVEIDDFKYINDRLSHVVGDQVLQALARILLANVPAVNVIGRYSGNTFMLILIETQLEQAVLICEKVVEAITKEDWRLIHPFLNVSISVGLSSLQKKPEKLSLVECADENLYQARRRGKNQVVGPR